MGPYKNILVALVVTETLGMLSTFLISYWIYAYLGGFGWEKDMDKMHNWHVLIMPIIVFLMGNGIIIYRVLRQFKASSVKWLHFIIHTVTLAAMGFGIMIAYRTRAAITSGHQSSKSHFFSLHSWLGIMVVLIFSLQYLCGACFFLFKCISEKKRELYAVIHSFFGLFAIITAAVASIVGISRKAEWTMEQYDQLVLPSVIVNSAGISLLLYVGCILYIAVNPFFEWYTPMTPTSSMN